MKRNLCWLSLLLTALLPACMGGILPKAPDRASYALPEPEALHARKPLPAALLVEVPRASQAVSGTDVVVMRADGEVQVLPQVRWVAPAPQLLQDLIARQIEVAGGAPAVAMSAQAYGLPLRLTINLLAFELREQPGGLSAHAAVSLRLVCAADARILAASQALAVDAAPVPDNPAAATAALRDAAGVLARQVLFWLDKVDASACPLD